jgi:hypothetical protein
LVARIRAALYVGISHKAVAAHAGLPLCAIHRISCGQTQPEITADPTLAAILAEWLSANNESSSEQTMPDNCAQGTSARENGSVP